MTAKRVKQIRTEVWTLGDHDLELSVECDGSGYTLHRAALPGFEIHADEARDLLRVLRKTLEDPTSAPELTEPTLGVINAKPDA